MFYCIGHPTGEMRHGGVGFAVAKRLVPCLHGQPTGVSPRIMTMQLNLDDSCKATFISVYAPTMMATTDEKDQFYENLDQVIANVPRNHKLFLMGDFNARVGRDNVVWDRVIGCHSVGNMNSNGLLLLQLCTQHELVLTNTLFQQPNKYKTTWQHPRSKHWHMLDYIVVRQRDVSDVHITRALRGSGVWSDHNLVRSKVLLQPARVGSKRKPRSCRRYDIQQLSDPDKLRSYQMSIQDCLRDVDDAGDATEIWENLRNAIRNCAGESIGYRTKNHKDWFDDNQHDIKHLLALLSEARAKYILDKTSGIMKNKYTNLRQTVQAQIRQMKERWWVSRASNIQAAFDSGNMTRFYSEMRTVCGPRMIGSAPVKSVDGRQLISDSDGILNRWAEHFNSVLNQQSSFDLSVLDEIENWSEEPRLDEPPTLAETVSAIQKLSNGKAAGADGIPAELYRAGGQDVALRLTKLFQQIWREEAVPQEFRDANIIHLYKNKGERAVCDNHRGISLLSVAGKILARVLLARLSDHVLQANVISESQCGFRSERSTVDMIFASRQLQEKCQEQQMDLYMVFVDLTKAFDSVNREGLWLVLEKIGCPSKFINVVRSFHDGMMATVTEDGKESDPFRVSNGTKQGCVLAPLLFSIYFAVMLQVAFKDCEDGIPIEYRVDGGVFNLRRLQAKSKILKCIIRDLLFADDCALTSHSQRDMQLIMDRFALATDRFGLTISLSKTVLMHQPARIAQQPQPTSVTVYNTVLTSVERFCYLGSTLHINCTADQEVTARLAKAGAAFGKLAGKLWTDHGISLSAKVSVYRACVLSTLLYGSESWTLYRRHIHRLDSFHLRCLRKIANIHWWMRVPNTTVLQKCNITGIEACLRERQLRWAGHLVRMEDHRLPKRLFYSQLCQGKRPQHGVKKRYKDSIKDTLKLCNIPAKDWETMATNRNGWRTTCRKAVHTFESQRVASLVVKRDVRKAGPTYSQDTSVTFCCQTCGRVCGSRIGLFAHSKTHNR